ncbi:unnamed protein product [Adineta steineri]|uniref:Uncharacterized protein n=1 Tax=Adineta steineri TaxID=433720 RepID=A0A813QXY0_9BILA|nr:unnamed protein product [Adineta steineri]CAF0801407.1 unnamed protein product [Adineta steineri]CAF3520305.1 unnamed protein product [Adineta steineri]CAF3803956.1 unnamed protein product [Adineta steineri]
MDHKQLLQSYRDEINKLHSRLSQLEVNSVEQRASDEVRKWRQTFDTTASKGMEQILNKMEKEKQAEVNELTNELRDSLNEFKEHQFSRLAELDAFILKINPDDDLEFDYVKFQLDSILSTVNSLHINITAQTVNRSNRRRLSTPLAQNGLELTKVFEFKTPEVPPSFMDRQKNFVRRLSSAGASYYNVYGT